MEHNFTTDISSGESIDELFSNNPERLKVLQGMITNGFTNLMLGKTTLPEIVKECTALVTNNIEMYTVCSMIGACQSKAQDLLDSNPLLRFAMGRK